jgi:hypothetical protein
VKPLRPVLHAADDGGDTQAEERVGEDRADERRLHELRQPLPQGEHRDDELGGVAERRVEQPAESRSQPRRDVLRPLADADRERDERERRAGEHGPRGTVGALDPERGRDAGEEDREPAGHGRK